MKIELGIMAPSISEQLSNASLKQTGKSVGLLDRLNDAITILYIHDIITQGECEKARKRLVKEIITMQISLGDV